MKFSLCLLLLLCCAPWIMAQSASENAGTAANNQNSSTSSTQPNTAQPVRGTTKITGCLQESNGNFKVKDDTTGTSYSLWGEQDMHAYTGKKVEVQGLDTSTSENVSAPTPSHDVGQKASENAFHVRSIKTVAGTCSNAGH